MSDTRSNEIIRVDMSAEQVTVEPMPDSWLKLGGRALSAQES